MASPQLDYQLAPSLLVAMPQLLDPNFHRGVVLILHHDESGSFGVVLNRETDLVMAENAIPASIKLIEGLIVEDPKNRTLLVNAAQALYGYAFGFVELHDPERAATRHEFDRIQLPVHRQAVA